MTMKDGNAAFGIIQSETDSELEMKGPTGAVTRHAKAGIKSRQQQPLSLMPPGLHLTIKEEELVDLIEYLASLKKKPDTFPGLISQGPVQAAATEDMAVQVRYTLTSVRAVIDHQSKAVFLQTKFTGYVPSFE